MRFACHITEAADTEDLGIGRGQARFQASAALVETCDFLRHYPATLVVNDRRFGYIFNEQALIILGLLDARRWDRYVVPKRR